MAMMAPMTTSTTMTPPSNSLLNNDLPSIPLMNEQGQESGPSKEDDLHDAHSEGSLQHGTGFVDMQCERVTRAETIFTEGAERDPDRTGVPVAAVGGSDEAEFVDSGNEGTHEAEVDEGDEEGGAFCR